MQNSVKNIKDSDNTSVMGLNKIKYIFFTAFVFIIPLISSCDEDLKPNNKYTNSIGYNIYNKDENLQKINDYRQSKDVDIILQYINSNNSTVQREIALALSVIADSNELITVTPFLSSADPHVRIATAFALGQSYSSMHENRLIDAYKNESNDYVKQFLLVAIAKCATSVGLNFIVSQEINEENEILLSGQGRAFYFLSQKGLITNQLIDKTFLILKNPNVSQDAKLEFSFLLASELSLDLSPYCEIINNQLKTNANVYYLSNLTEAFKHISPDCNVDDNLTTLNLLENILNSDKDYRIKISAIKALSAYNYNQVKSIMLDAVLNENSSVAKTAADYLVLKGNSADANEYFTISKKIIPWQARTTVISAALLYSTNKTSIVNSIISGYNAVENKYEKAALLYALSADPSQYQFVKDEAFSASDKVISTAGIKSLYAMRLSSNFDKIAYSVQQTTGTDLYSEFSLIFKEAMTSGNKMMIYYASKIYAQKDLNIIEDYENTYFMSQAADELAYPADVKIRNEICKTLIAYGNQPCNQPVVDNFEIDWNIVNSIAPEQRVLVKTSRGDFEMTLDVNSAPATVGTFYELVQNGYYNNTYFFKNIPGKAIVTGGKRGDGEMNFNKSLINEINLKNFKDGSVAMRVLGDDYQSVNWFVATSPVISYDNSFTIFAEVTKGLNIVHSLDVGDKIIEIIIL